MKRVLRVFLYTLTGYVIWMTVIMLIYSLLPDELKDSKFFIMTSSGLSSVFVVLLSVLYLRKVQISSWKEGLGIGLLATVFIVLFDIGHNILMGIELKSYFTLTVPTFFVIPLVTSLIMGNLEKKQIKR